MKKRKSIYNTTRVTNSTKIFLTIAVGSPCLALITYTDNHCKTRPKQPNRRKSILLSFFGAAQPPRAHIAVQPGPALWGFSLTSPPYQSYNSMV